MFPVLYAYVRVVCKLGREDALFTRCVQVRAQLQAERLPREPCCLVMHFYYGGDER